MNLGMWMVALLLCLALFGHYAYARFSYIRLYQKTRVMFDAINGQRIRANGEATAENLESQVKHWRKSAQRAHARRYHEIAKIVEMSMHEKPHTQKRVLDVGCGDGYLFEQLVKGINLATTGLYGLDIAGRRLSLTRSRVKGARVIQGDAQRMPFADRVFSLVICSETLEHLVDPVSALSELIRMLADGGILILTVPSIHVAFLSINPLSWLEAVVSVYLPSILPPYHDLYDPSDNNTVIHRAFSYAYLRESLGPRLDYVHFSSSYAHLEGILPLPDDLAGLELLWRKIPVLNRLGRIIFVTARKGSRSQI